MGPISKKLGRRFAKWSRQFRQSAKTVPIPKDVRDVGTLVKDGHDPLHAVYISVQNITSVFAECVSVLPELEPYSDVIAAAEDEYMPSGPPMSPLTRSYFTTWAFFDFRFGGDLETIGTCLLDVSDRLGLNPGMVEAIRLFQESRMGVYEHCGTQGERVRLRELVTGRDFDVLCTSGYRGKPGELWYIRLCPPLADLVEYNVSMTTPYVLTQASKSDWTAYLNRAMLQLKDVDENQRLHELLKYGLGVHHWNEFVFQGYHHHQFDAIFLAGIPDVKGSLPHAESPTDSPALPSEAEERSSEAEERWKRLAALGAKGVIPTPEGEAKMSAVILKVAEPLVKKYAETPEQAKAVIMFVIDGWNKSLFPLDKQAVVEKEILAPLVSKGANAETIAMIVDIMNTAAKRRRKLFPDLRKIVVDHKVTISGDSFNLNVSSAPAPDDWKS